MNSTSLHLGTQGLEANNVIKERILEAKSAIKKGLIDYAGEVKELKLAEKNKAEASRKYEKKQNIKTETRYNESVNAYKAIYEGALYTLNDLTVNIADIERDWNKLIFQISILDVKSVPKEQNEFNKFKKAYDGELSRLAEQLKLQNIELLPTVKLTPDPEEPIYEAEPSEISEVKTEQASEPVAPIAAEPATPVKEEKPISAATSETARPGISLAPINIDISTYVERAVKQAMEKMSGALDARIEEYFRAYSPSVGAVGTVSAETANLQGKIADDEKFLLDKLVGIVEVLKRLNTEIATVSAAYTELDGKLREIAELQKETNDMQRYTMREQQGVQVNQRVVNKDQLSIAEEQLTLTEGNKKSVEEQKRVASSQQAVAENQKAIIDTQTSIEEAMKALLAEQKKIISSQQQIVAENAKQLDSYRLIGEKQREIAEEQKTVLVEQKQRLREQKALGARVKPKESAEQSAK